MTSDGVCPDLSFTEDCIDPFDPENPNLWVKLEHLGRYLFAADYLRSRHPDQIADMACGLGYGLPELTQVAPRVLGVDSNPKVLQAAQTRWNQWFSTGPGTLTLCHQNLDDTDWPSPLAPNSLDAIVSFETLEHLLEPERVVAHFAQTLKANGLLIGSVPSHLHDPPGTAGLPVNPYHKQFFSFERFRRLLENHGFEVTYRLGQASSNRLYKQESQLLKRRSLTQRLGEFSPLHTPALIRHLSYLLAYPSADDLEGSYALIVVAQKH
ncbi:class I SAM-dependent methyltransferase [Nodosilinea sp. P-1105]|uniref:class I SAM-dependent DNA methyltransferase n=1 Tax=Nodosilinea sp. P-1105 TaxID=2546229 RepID=UPI00146B9669|nr:class I SAM-dependent methyltransferase [Nodosilinea sp. P-1105]NMF85833.1 class I SAM-dependent methyltransferase [Nodosilinea sp. P-1105]